MLIKNKLKEKNIELPPFNNAAANYTPAVISGNLIFTAGQTPKYDGVLIHKGKVDDTDYDKGIKASRLCALNCLSIISSYAGGLDNVSRIVKVNGFVNASSDFTMHAKVLDGATNLLVELFGELGRPARSAVGVASLPGDATVEIEMIVELKNNANNL